MRLALGAPAGSVRWSVQKRCLVLVCAGLAIGLPVAYGLSTLMRSLLYETQPAEASAYVMVLVVFAIVALTASYVPGATRVANGSAAASATSKRQRSPRQRGSTTIATGVAGFREEAVAANPSGTNSGQTVIRRNIPYTAAFRVGQLPSDMSGSDMSSDLTG